MNNPAATALRAIARQILAQADAIDGQGVTVTTDKPILIRWGDELITTDEAEARGRAEIADRLKPHGHVAPGLGVLREETGTGEGAPRSFVTHRAIIDAAERGDPANEGGARVFTDGQGGWPGPDGKVFRMDDYKPRGPRAMHDVTEWLWTKSPEGIAWKASPAVQAQLPRNSDGSLADPELEPISR